MNEPIRKGNVYRSLASDYRVYFVKEVGIRTATVVNIRTDKEYIIKFKALTDWNELIGTPYERISKGR